MAKALPKEREEESGIEDVGGELVVTGGITGALERPRSIGRDDLYGTEDITADDVRLPRIGIAQGLSPQMTPDAAEYIDGLKLTDMFNDLTGEIYGRGPLTFIACRRDVRRIEFIPRSEGGGIADLNVPPHDPRNDWTTVEGVKMPPRATKFTEFVVLLLLNGRAPEPIVLSIKHTNKWNTAAADRLTTFIKMRRAPIYAGLYTVTTKPEKNDKGTFGIFVVRNAGWIPKDSPNGAKLYTFAEEFAKSLEGKEIVVNREVGEDDFDPNELEGQSRVDEM